MARFVKAMAAGTLLIGFGGWLTAAASSLLPDGLCPVAASGGAGSLWGVGDALLSAIYGTCRSEEVGPLGLGIFFVCVFSGAIMMNVAVRLEGEDALGEYDAEES